MMNTEKLNRVEVITEDGRVLVLTNVKVDLSFQDDDKTLKVFAVKVDTRTDMEKVRDIALDEMNKMDEQGWPAYEFAGNLVVMCESTGENKEEYYNTRFDMCCGIVEKSFVLNGNVYLYAFDYGH